jgi:hypothetical protein
MTETNLAVLKHQREDHIRSHAAPATAAHAALEWVSPIQISALVFASADASALWWE